MLGKRILIILNEIKIIIINKKHYGVLKNINNIGNILGRKRLMSFL